MYCKREIIGEKRKFKEGDKIKLILADFHLIYSCV
jgi:hypothetical protein